MFADSPLFAQTVAAATSERDDVALQALWAVANATTNASDAPSLAEKFMKEGVVAALYQNFRRSDARTKAVAMEGFTNCLKALRRGDSNEAAEYAIKTDSCTRIAMLASEGGAIGDHAEKMMAIIRQFLPSH